MSELKKTKKEIRNERIQGKNDEQTDGWTDGRMDGL